MQVLTLVTANGIHCIDGDVFTANSGKLQEAILDYQEEVFRQKPRKELDVPGFCRRRFRTPLRVTGREWCEPSGWAYWFSGPGVSTDQAVLQFSAEGFGMGRDEDNLRVIPWESILFARMRNKVVNFRTSRLLVVHLRDDSRIVLADVYSRSLDELQEFLDPPLHKVRMAYRWIASGDDIETAAVKAQLPSRCSLRGANEVESETFSSEPEDLTSAEPVPCLECGTIILPGSARCPTCGWTYAADEGPG
jgi:hypothetical protein